MKKYLMICRNCFMSCIAYRFHFIFTAFTNGLYVILIYFLWQAIYKNSPILGNMTFIQTFVYLACARSLSLFFQSWTDFNLSRKIISGDIIMNLLKPMDLQLMMIFNATGFVIFNLISITIPSFIMIFVIFGARIPIGINLIFFPVSLVFAFCLSTTFDYLTGLITFYTESIWGIHAVKESVILFLSGAIIPLSFFPDFMKKILELLPFQAIYNIPLTILTSEKLVITHYLSGILIQLFWILVLIIISRLFFRQAVKVLTINGG